MSENEVFASEDELKVFLSTVGLREVKAAEAARVLFGTEYDEPDAFYEISSDKLVQTAGLTNALAHTLSSKLKKRQHAKQQQDGELRCWSRIQMLLRLRKGRSRLNVKVKRLLS
jgi:hypothetical protein